MIHIWIWEFPIPPGLEFLNGPWVSPAATLLFWLLVAIALQFVVFRAVKASARRSATEIDDVIIDVSRRPLILAIILAGSAFSLDALEVETELAAGVRRWLIAGIMAVVTYWLWRFLKEVVLHYGEILARRSETRADDVLVPIVNQFAPIVIFSVGGAVILQYLGLRLDALLVAIGGAAFIMAFALQDILSNVFSGLSLLVDTPFRYGDLITLEDGKVCQVLKIGVRVTQLYDIGAHAVIYAPNSKLASERLTNLMQPTPELISVVPIEVGQGNDPEAVRALLNEVLQGHPDLVGELDRKLERIDDFLILSPAKRAHGRTRMLAESTVDGRVASVIEGLRAFADEIRTREARGLSRDERSELLGRYEPIRIAIGATPNVGRRLAAFVGSHDEFVDSISAELQPDSVARATWAWTDVWGRDPDLIAGDDLQHLRVRWSERIVALLRRSGGLAEKLEQGGGLELRLDEDVLALVGWLRREFKQKAPSWKHSGTGFRGLVGGGFVFRMMFYVDDIELEHFTRQARVEGEVRREAHRRLRERGISLPAPRYEIAWAGAEKASGDGPGSRPASVLGRQAWDEELKVDNG
jgi:MscS family membrane protein